MKDDDIKIKIAEVAKAEFVELGYVDASMRNISAKAGLTTGSLYNRFRDKAELFDFIVGDQVRNVFDEFQKYNNHYTMNVDKTLINTFETSAIKFLLDKIYSNFDSFNLIITKGIGSPYEDFLDKIIAVATENASLYISTKHFGKENPKIATDFTHLINVALFNAIAEMVRKNYSYDEALFYMENLYKFYYAGWTAVIGE